MTNSLVLRLGGLDQPALRLSWLAAWVRQTPMDVASVELEGLMEEAECFSDASTPALVAWVSWISGALDPPTHRALSKYALRTSLFRLGRMLAFGERCPDVDLSQAPPDSSLPDYGRSRPLTLGERKNLARRSVRKDIERLCRDPHPAVIAELLSNPQLTEPDLLHFVTSSRVNVASICHVLRHARWVTASKIRMGVLQNPALPTWQTVPLLSLCTRPELASVARARRVPAELQGAALGHVARHPPVLERSKDPTLH